MAQMQNNDQAIYFFHQGTNFDTQNFLGAHRLENGKDDLAVFRIWAPRAQSVSVVGDFNGWDSGRNIMTRISDGGVFECVISGVKQFDCYKFSITANGRSFLKSDPYGFHFQTRPANATKFYDNSHYQWGDGEYLNGRTAAYDRPINIYEVHVGSWRLHEDGSPFSYRELADALPDYARGMGFTHIELLPLAEHPFDGSWGYQVTGYYAPTSRFGTPEDFKYFVDCCHQKGIGVIMDWVPAHFPKDAFALYEFDGGSCYEYSDPFKREHKDWGTMVFDFGKPEVQSFLVSNACFWLSEYHIDGLRVDAVASMLYLDYGRKNGQWRLNGNGGRENLEAVAFLQKLNTQIFARFPHALMFAEESTAWPMVTGRVSDGALGFNYKWNMGWMNDLLSYIKNDPLFRSGDHNKLTFSIMYAFSENFVLPISHDEVVHGKHSLLDKMPGEYEQKFSGLRMFMAYMFAHPGKKLTFMGCEFAQFIEWNYQQQLDWLLLDYEAHRRFSGYISALNHIYLENSPLWQLDTSSEGFYWLNADDCSRSVISFARRDKENRVLIAVCNFSGAEYSDYHIGVSDARPLRELLNSSCTQFGGTNHPASAPYHPKKAECCGKPYRVSLTLPPLTTIYLTTEPN